jgi:hypothetical protein
MDAVMFPNPMWKKCCYFAEPDTGTKLKGEISEGSETLPHEKVVEVVCHPPVWRMLRKTLAYFISCSQN